MSAQVALYGDAADARALAAAAATLRGEPEADVSNVMLWSVSPWAADLKNARLRPEPTAETTGTFEATIRATATVLAHRTRDALARLDLAVTARGSTDGLGGVDATGAWTVSASARTGDGARTASFAKSVARREVSPSL